MRDDGNLSPSEEVVQLLKTTLSSCRHKVETAEKQVNARINNKHSRYQKISVEVVTCVRVFTQVQDLLSASERLQEENKTLQQLNSDQNRHAEVNNSSCTKPQSKKERF